MENPENPDASLRTVVCGDAIEWLETAEPVPGRVFVSSLPDRSEFPKLSLPQWKEWFLSASSLILSRTPADGVAVFYQTDIKCDGVWVDKGYLCQKAAELSGHELLWHRIICRIPPGTSTGGRPSYTHALCFSKSVRAEAKLLLPDVLPDCGEKTWEPGMGLDGALLIARFIAEHTAAKSIVNPFCGQGAMLAAANAVGLKAIGIERSPKRAAVARALSISSDCKRWIVPEDSPSPQQ